MEWLRSDSTGDNREEEDGSVVDDNPKPSHRAVLLSNRSTGDKKDQISARFVAGSGKDASAEVVPSKHASKGKTGSVKSKNTQEDPLASTSLDRETVVSNATNSSDSGGCKSDAAQSARTTDPMDNGGNEDLMESPVEACRSEEQGGSLKEIRAAELMKALASEDCQRVDCVVDDGIEFGSYCLVKLGSTMVLSKRRRWARRWCFVGGGSLYCCLNRGDKEHMEFFSHNGCGRADLFSSSLLPVGEDAPGCVALNLGPVARCSVIFHPLGTFYEKKEDGALTDGKGWWERRLAPLLGITMLSDRSHRAAQAVVKKEVVQTNHLDQFVASFLSGASGQCGGLEGLLCLSAAAREPQQPRLRPAVIKTKNKKGRINPNITVKQQRELARKAMLDRLYPGSIVSVFNSSEDEWFARVIKVLNEKKLLIQWFEDTENGLLKESTKDEIWLSSVNEIVALEEVHEGVFRPTQTIFGIDSIKGST